jgi:oligoendopeptidase F
LTTATVEFVPQNLDATRWENIEPLVNALRDRPVSSPAEFQRWLTDRSELDAACSESQATLYINMTCDTQNQEAQQAYTAYIETVAPLLKPASFALMFRSRPIWPSSRRSTSRSAAHDRRVRRERQTLPQMGKYQEATDRAVREAAWKAVAERR